MPAEDIMAHFTRGACWTRQDMVDNGYRRDDKPVISTPTLPSKPSVDYSVVYLARNARNGYTVNFDAIMGLWRDGIDYMRAVEWACYWLTKFNERSGVV